MGFSVDIASFVNKVRANQDVVVRKITFELFSMAIEKSPVDSGRFKGNWVAQMGAPSSWVDYTVKDKSGGSATAKVATLVATVKAGDVIYMSNNLPYAQRLEYGHSKQAPSGMVRVSIQHIVSWINSIKV